MSPGEVFGRLTAVARIDGSTVKWLFRCACGAKHIAALHHVQAGRTQSCGCLRRSIMAARQTTHGGSGTRLHWVWKAMLDRCSNPNNKRYHRYGGRGVVVNADFLSFDGFRDWALANGYSPGLTIERMDNDGPYSAENCRWATLTEQARNRSSTRWVQTPAGVVPAVVAAQISGLKYSTLSTRLNSGGKSDADALRPL